MHIIAGKFKGRIIEMPKGIRPTLSKVREAVFEISKERIKGARFLDLYCGSGAMGIEAFSRGAKEVSFVDNSSRCISVLRRNLVKLGIEAKKDGQGRISIYKKDARGAFELFEKSERYFDIIFLDPPYYKDIARNILIAFSEYAILLHNAVVIVEIYKKEVLPEETGLLRRIGSYHYGDTRLEFFMA